jgi:hypothetical protein
MIPFPLDLPTFWCLSWSLPLRTACHWLTRQPVTLAPPNPLPSAPRWLRPLFLQRWVGQAVLARRQWQRAHPDAMPYRYGAESLPCWVHVGALPYDRACLRALGEASVLWLWGVEVERLLRISEIPPVLVGVEDWTQAMLGACGHLAQLYQELKRRHRAKQARVLVRAALQAFVAWESDGAAGGLCPACRDRSDRATAAGAGARRAGAGSGGGRGGRGRSSRRGPVAPPRPPAGMLAAQVAPPQAGEDAGALEPAAALLSISRSRFTLVTHVAWSPVGIAGAIIQASSTYFWPIFRPLFGIFLDITRYNKRVGAQAGEYCRALLLGRAGAAVSRSTRRRRICRLAIF